MKLKTLYELIVKKAIKEDPRPKSAIDESLKRARSEYRRATGPDKRYFDKERLTNPYSDTRILNGTGNEEIRNVMIGIDIDVGEVLLADRLREKGTKIDLIISHHPNGRAYAQLYDVMNIQPSIWEKYGLKKKVAEGIMKERVQEVFRGVLPRNHTQSLDAAKLLKIPFMCCHTPSDNCVTTHLQKILDSKKPKKLKNVLAILKSIPEYKEGMKVGAGPVLFAGKETDDAGKIFVDMTGGTSGPDKLIPRISQAGVNTLVSMHCRESAYKLAKTEFMNLVIAGHISSDTLGLNLLFDEIEKKEKLKFIECSGFKRIRR